MGDDDEKRELLRKALRELTQAEGVRRDNLRSVLTPDLIAHFRIKRSDSPRQVRDKVADLLEELTRSLSEENQKIARYSFNITEARVKDILTLGGRQKALQDSGGVAVRTSQDEITKTILPNFADQLLARRVRRQRVLIGSGGAAAVVVLAVVIVLLVGLSSGDDARGTSGGGSSQTQTTTTTDPPIDPAEAVPMTFDDLGGRDPIIQVYPGVSDSTADKLNNGTFRDGQTMYALCKTKGRRVYSHPELGEREWNSDMWIRIHGTPGATQYATVVYVENPNQLLAQLRDC